MSWRGFPSQPTCVFQFSNRQISPAFIVCRGFVFATKTCNYGSRSPELGFANMLDKSAYYHGAAVIPVLEDSRCRSIRKLGTLGYVVNDDTFLFIKYTTKARSPWRFTFDQEDIDRCARMSGEYRRLVFGFVCGGDGVCAVCAAATVSVRSTGYRAKNCLGRSEGRKLSRHSPMCTCTSEGALTGPRKARQRCVTAVQVANVRSWRKADVHRQAASLAA
jgi:hypothetical protein